MKDISLSSKKFFDSINKFSDLSVLVRDGTSENQILECKLINSLNGFNQSLEAELRKEISGFANTIGGILAFGLDCDNKRGVDIITQVSPIGEIKLFESKFKIKAPLLVRQRIDFETKIIKKKPTDTKGILLAYIYPTSGDPIQASDGKFYMRVGDQTPEMPYEIIKRMMLGINSPDLEIDIDFKYINYKSDTNLWEIPIAVSNLSNYPAKNTTLLIFVPKQDNVIDVNAPAHRDISNINKYNPKGWYFSKEINGNIYKGLSISSNPINIKMANKKIKASFEISVYSEGMVAKVFKIDVYLPKSGVPAIGIKSNPMY